MPLTEEQWADFESVIDTVLRAKALIQGELKVVLEKAQSVKTEIIDNEQRRNAILPVVNQYFISSVVIISDYNKLVSLYNALTSGAYFTF